MKSMSGVPGGTAPTPPTGVEPREPVSPAPVVSEDPAPQHSAPEIKPAPAREELEAAVTELQGQLDLMPGGEREVRLLFEQEDNSYVVEIRDKETGDLIQKFPPENLLNPDRSSADLLGTVVDRHS